MITEKQLEDYKQTVVRKGVFPSLIFLSLSMFIMILNITFYFSHLQSVLEILFNVLLTGIWLILLAYSYLEYLEKSDGIYLYAKGLLIIENNSKVAFSYKEIDYFSEYNDIKKGEYIDALTFNTQSSFARRQRKFLFVLKNKRVVKTMWPTTKKRINKISKYIPFEEY